VTLMAKRPPRPLCGQLVLVPNVEAERCARDNARYLIERTPAA